VAGPSTEETLMKATAALAVLAFALSLHGQNKPPAPDTKPAARKSAGSTLRIVNDQLIEVDKGDCRGCLYAVKGSIYNPNIDGVRDVVVRYYIWKKWMGKDGYGSIIKDTGGLVSATIKYLPPRQTVDFVATSQNAGVMGSKSGLLPDPISAEITAKWEGK
jgi:hypothetical protein